LPDAYDVKARLLKEKINILGASAGREVTDYSLGEFVRFRVKNKMVKALGGPIGHHGIVVSYAMGGDDMGPCYRRLQ
jgi:hypothetical protein